MRSPSTHWSAPATLVLLAIVMASPTTETIRSWRTGQDGALAPALARIDRTPTRAATGQPPPEGRLPGLPDGLRPAKPTPSAATSPGPSPSASPSPAQPTPATAPTNPGSRAPAPRAEATADVLADRLSGVPAATSQLVVVHSTGWSTSYATLETFSRGPSGWRAALPAMPARIGSLGFSDHHTEGTPTTPTGMYTFAPTMYGISPDPGVRYGYHQLVAGDWWNENSGTPGYNTFTHGADPGGPSEALWQEAPAYNHFAMINYNVPAVPGRGSAIFLHQQSGGATAGCVSLSGGDLVAVLRWLSPAASPRIVMGPDQQLTGG